jgi:hypothetical protein
MSTTIAATRLNTPLNDVGRVDICHGFPLFRESPGPVESKFGDSRQWTLIDTEPQVLAWKMHFVAGVGFYYGICGASYAVDATFSGVQDGNTLTLTGSQSRAIAGVEMGFGLRLFFTVDIQQWSVSTHWVSDGWHSHLEFDTAWKNVGRINFDHTFDVIAFLAQKIANKGYEVRESRYPSGLGLSAVDATTNNQLVLTGTTTLNPTFSGIFDITDSYAPLAALKKQLQDTYNATLAAGPTIGLSLPTTISVVKAATNGASYDLQAHEGTLKGSRKAASSVGAGDLEVTFRHTAGVAFHFGIELKLSWSKLACISRSTGPLLDLLAMLGWSKTWGPFDHPILARMGATVSVTPEQAPEREVAYEVVFEHPEPVVA